MDTTRINLSTAVDILRGTNEALDQSTRDFDRLKHVLKSNQVFQVATLKDMAEAKQQLAAEMEPQVNKLLERLEQAVSLLEGRERALSSKAELQEGRLNRTQIPSSSTAGPPASEEQLLRLQELQEKKHQLVNALKTANMEKQKARMGLVMGERLRSEE